MTTPRSTPSQAGSNKVLWAALAVVMVIVLVMGATLIRIRTQAQEPRPLALPASTKPAAHASAAADSAATAPVTTAAPVQPAPAAQSSGTPANAPRTVQLRASEPAVARTPARVTPRLDAVEGETLPGVSR